MKPIPTPTRPLALLLTALAVSLSAGCSESDTKAPASPETERLEAPQAATEPQAWFEFESAEHDFGEVYAGALRKTTFDLTAAGPEPLVVDSLKRSCGCTEGELFVVDADGGESPVELKKAYRPGTQFKLLATLNTKGREGDQLQRVHIVNNGSATPTSFALKASIKTFLEIEPTELAQASTLEGLSGDIYVRSRGGELMKLDCRRDILPEELELDFSPVEPDADGNASRWKVAYRILPGVPEGVFKRKVILVTDQTNEQAAPLGDGSLPTHVGEMWLRTDVEGVFDYRPERFDFGRMLPGQRVTKKIIIRSRDPEFDMGAVRIALFDGTGVPLPYEDEFDIKAKAIDPGKVWEIEIQIVDPPVTGGFGGIVGIKLDHPLQEDIQIPFMGRLAAPN